VFGLLYSDFTFAYSVDLTYRYKAYSSDSIKYDAVLTIEKKCLSRAFNELFSQYKAKQ